MTTTDALSRLADARPAVAETTCELVAEPDREALLQAILATSEDESVASTASGPPRRRLRLATAFSAPAAVGVVVVALVWATAPSAERNPTSAGPGPTSAAPTVALDRVRLAVAEAEDLILHMTSDHGNGVLWDAWFDMAGGQARTTSRTVAGAPLYDHEMTPREGEGMTVKVVSYDDRAWWTYATPPERGGARFSVGLSAADIRSQLADGTLEEIGPENLDGRNVVHLRWMPHSKPGFVTVPGDMWVDATTYLPVRSVNRWGTNGDKATRSEYEWLPRSGAAMANLKVPVPAGFVQRAGAPEDPPGARGVG